MSDENKGRPLPKFGEWDVNDPASAEGFTVIFNKARDEKKTGGKTEPAANADANSKPGADPGKPQQVKKESLLRVVNRSCSRLLS
ncbi:protein NOI4-like [Hibiscus syriacus]|uniref:protein NOI4-like n=1 Tax=Hibiscus syriacus TaxID=106335 RepID=UPI001920B324|nr:protein NOI4-like [Hibiscus syriacus]